MRQGSSAWYTMQGLLHDKRALHDCVTPTLLLRFSVCVMCATHMEARGLTVSFLSVDLWFKTGSLTDIVPNE